MSRFQSRSVASAVFLAALVGCTESDPGHHDDHRSHVRVVSTSVNLAAYDLCWATESGEVRIELDAEMVDASATRQLALSLETGVRASLVAPGEGCDAPSATRLALDWSGLSEEGEDAVLLVTDVTREEAHGRVLSAEGDGEENHALRSSSCEGAEPYARRESFMDGSGACRTRARLYECRTVYVGMGEYISGYTTTYDSGWVDCSQPRCDEITDL